MMGRSNEIRIMQRMIREIVKHGTIHNFDLREKLNISKSQYNTIKPDLERRFHWQVIYNKQTKCWEKVEEEEDEV